MKKELRELLKDRYPAVYRDCTGWAFSDGWFGILNVLGEQLTNIASTEKRAPTAIIYMKEKYAQLSIFADGATSRDYQAIEFAEAMSAVICEACGKPGRMVKRGGWYSTMCPEHQGLSAREVERQELTYDGPTDPLDQDPPEV
ncbi:hypothetical protein D9M68_715710 [compost metagenome]